MSHTPKLFAFLFAIMPIIANANIPFTQQDLIGKWECKVLLEYDIRATSNIEYRNDGIITDHSVIYTGTKSDDFYQIDTLKTLSKWQVTGDKVRYYDNIIQSYVVDMPNYDNINDAVLSTRNKEAMMIVKAMMERSEAEKMTSEDMISRIRFLDKDTYITTFEFEGVEEDFPTDIENNHCKRKI